MFWVIVLSIVFGFVLRKLLLDDKNPLDQLPGPTRKPVIGSILEFIFVDSRQLFLMVRQFFAKFGDRFLIKVFNRRLLQICGPNDIEQVLPHSKNITKSMYSSFLQPWLGTGLVLSTGTKWHQRRKILTPTFHFNILKNFSIIMEEKSRDLIQKLKNTSGNDVDLLPQISDFTLFTICETALGTQLDKDQSAKAVEYKSAIQDIGQLIMNRLVNVWLHNDFVFSLTAQGKQYNEYLKKVHEFADNVIKERRNQRGGNSAEFTAALQTGDAGSKRRLAMLDLLLEAEDRGEIDTEGIREEVNTFMFAGYDTTALASTFALMLIADHEDVQERIYGECQSIFGASDRTPTAADWAEMKYLDAVIKEVLRLYPSVPFITRLITDDFVMGDLPIKKGSEVVVHIYDLHRRADLYSEPEEFRPERFVDREYYMHTYSYVPFSAGPRNCIGQKFAQMEMKCIISALCRAFRLQPKVRGERPEVKTDLLLRPINPVYVKFLPR